MTSEQSDAGMMLLNLSDELRDKAKHEAAAEKEELSEVILTVMGMVRLLFPHTGWKERPEQLEQERQTSAKILLDL